jgi:hypothetical protein
VTYDFSDRNFHATKKEAEKLENASTFEVILCIILTRYHHRQADGGA